MRLFVILLVLATALIGCGGDSGCPAPNVELDVETDPAAITDLRAEMRIVHAFPGFYCMCDLTWTQPEGAVVYEVRYAWGSRDELPDVADSIWAMGESIVEGEGVDPEEIWAEEFQVEKAVSFMSGFAHPFEIRYVAKSADIDSVWSACSNVAKHIGCPF